MLKNSLSPAPAAAPSAPSPWMERLWGLFLAMCLIQYTGAWIYPAAAESGALDTLLSEKILGTQYQLVLWLMITGGALVHTLRCGFGRLFSALHIFLPFWLAGLVASLFGFSPFTSLHYFVLWTMALIAAALVGSELAPQRAIRLLGYTMLFLMLGSVLMSVLVPAIGAQRYGFTSVWRGLFTNKNQLGWVAAICLILCQPLRRSFGWRVSLLLALSSCACLLFSGSKGALLAAIVTMGFVWLVGVLAPRVTLGFGVAVMAFLFAVAGVFGALVLPYLLELLGRDMTLTGRTDVWATFFRAMTDSLWFGQGAASFTALSPFTLPLAAKLQSLGAIVTPHNIYLGVLGDSGLFGLVTFLGLLFYLTMLVPLRTRSAIALTTAGVGFLMLSHGLVETHDVFSPGIGWFLLALGRSLTLQQELPAAANAEATPPLPAMIYSRRF